MSSLSRTTALLVVCIAAGCAAAIEDSELAGSATEPIANAPPPAAATPIPTAPPSMANTAPAVAPTPSVTPPRAESAINTPPAAMAPAPAAPAAAPAMPQMPAAATPTTTAFDAGSGMLHPDGKTVVFHIPDGTGANDWNAMSKPIRVRHGMTLRLVDDDSSKQHFLHTNGQPCSHPSRPIGDGFDCVIQASAPMGLVSGVLDHSAANGGRGRLFIEVVE